MRAKMERRLGFSFKDVRIHADPAASRSATEIDAEAYTVGRDVVFAAGRYAPETVSGRRLLAHELVHAAQQRATQSTFENLVIGPKDCPDEREAEHASSASFTALTSRSVDGVVRRQSRAPSQELPPGGVPDASPATDGGASAGSVDAGPSMTPDAGASGTSGAAGAVATPTTLVCGPDVTSQVAGVLAAINAAWSHWNPTEREEACWAIEDLSCGPDAWDIVDLHNNAWIYQDYRPACASAGGNPRCGSSIKVDSDCHNAGSVNYVMLGAMCKLCNIWKATMHAMIWAHKVHLSGMDPDYAAAVKWADAGFAGWAAGSSPAGDRNNCAPTCPTAFGATTNHSSTTFDFHWFPTHQTETVSPACDRSLVQHRTVPVVAE